ncbi:MAG: alpha-mannosidase 2C1, partial [Acidimicrobiia bacterium]
MPQPAKLTRTRAQRVLRRLIEPARRGRTASVTIEAAHLPGEPVSVTEAARLDYVPFAVGDPWGPMWGTTWFRVGGAVPREWKGAKVALVVHLGYGGATGFGAEGLVWSGERPAQGISPNHREVLVAERAAGDDDVSVLIEAASNPPIDPFADPAPYYLA